MVLADMNSLCFLSIFVTSLFATTLLQYCTWYNYHQLLIQRKKNLEITILKSIPIYYNKIIEITSTWHDNLIKNYYCYSEFMSSRPLFPPHIHIFSLFIFIFLPNFPHYTYSLPILCTERSFLLFILP